MRGNGRDKSALRFCQADSVADDVFRGFVDLAEAVFAAGVSPPWPVWTMVDASSRCVAGLQCRILRLAGEGESFEVAALRNVAVAVDWRGFGLMRDLVERALVWCDSQAATTLLYAETPVLYARFGFAPLPQYAFEGEAPEPAGEASARPLDFAREGELLGRLLATRGLVSSRCSVIDDGGLAADLLGSGTWPMAYDTALDAVIVHEVEDDTLVLVDIVASRVPSAARILGALGARPARLRTLFPPDRLDWTGVPVTDDTGLMARGNLPLAMQRPFMLPPTVGF